MEKLKINYQAATDFCLRPGEEHEFKIISGSGRKSGTPRWRCTRCKRVIISS